MTNLFLGGAAPLLSLILSLSLVDDTNKNSCIERSLFVCNAFPHREWSESLLNLSPLYTFVSKNAISESDISTVNFILSW